MYMPAELVLLIWNVGIASGLILGAMLVLRPVLCKLLTPRQRSWVWMLGWYGTSMMTAFRFLGLIHIFPVTFRDLIIPRTSSWAYSMPAYLPTDYRGTGEYAVALPGGKAVWIQMTDGMLLALVLVWLAGIGALCLWMRRRTQRLKELGRQGELLDPQDPLVAGIRRKGERDRLVAVRLCRNLPTSFVYPNGEKLDDGDVYDMIYLQRELSPQRLELVLRHEWNHLRLRHGWMKGWANLVLVLWWWNPILWAAYYYFCRDLELSCDEQTLSDLAGPEERKRYAQTLVELAAGKMLWGEPLAFGECGAVARVKAAVAWHKPQWWVKLGKRCAFVLVFLFFVGGPRNIPFLPEDVVWKWQQADIEVELSEDWMPVERWMRVEQDGDMALLAKDTAGKWHKMSYWCSAWNGTFLRLSDWETMLGSPDLTGAQPGLW